MANVSKDCALPSEDLHWPSVTHQSCDVVVERVRSCTSHLVDHTLLPRFLVLLPFPANAGSRDTVAQEEEEEEEEEDQNCKRSFYQNRIGTGRDS